jgi:poly(A) polymerase
VGEGKPVAPSFLLACVLWEDVRKLWQDRMAQGEHVMPALQTAMDDVFGQRVGDVSGRGKLAADMREIWAMQPRFERRSGQAPFNLVEQPRFRAGFDFLRLRADAREIDDTLADWWQEFSLADDAAREDLVQQARAEQAPRGRAPRKSAPRSAAAPAADTATEGGPDLEAGGEAGDGPARPRRRRRRRKPSAGGDGA